MPNVHMADATERLDGTDRTPSSDDVARAHAEGVLAQAYELRTRNLIAFLDLAAREGWDNDGDGRTMRTMIVEALDLATISELVDGTYKMPEPAITVTTQAINAERSRIMRELAVFTSDGQIDRLADVIFERVDA